MSVFGDRIQALADEVYGEWRKEENKGRGKWDILGGFSEAHQIAVAFGNFNYQVENGGLEQWIYNGYFHDDAEKLAGYLEAGAESDERCRTILERIYKLDRCARETECDRHGGFRDPGDEDGESGFIGDMIDCDAFDTWYYGHCGKEDWWQTVCGIIDKSEGRGLPPAGRDERSAGDAAAPHPLRAYIENARDDRIGGFTIPLPATAENLRPFLKGAEIRAPRDMRIAEVRSGIEGLGDTISSYPGDGLRLDELSCLAARIVGLPENGREIFAAAVEAKRHTGSVAELINLTENIGNFDLQPVFGPEHYGEFLIEADKDRTSAIFDRLERSGDTEARMLAEYIVRLEAHVDEAAYGRAAAEREGGVFTERGYLTEHGEFKEVYRGPADIPAECRVFEPPCADREPPAAGRERVSVMEWIREAKAAPKQPRKAKSPDKSHGEER